MLRLILLAFVCSFTAQIDSDSNELPAWARAPAESNLFVVETEEFSMHGDAAKSLLPAVKAAVVEWAESNVDRGCRTVIEAMPLEDFKQFIHENQEVIHDEQRKILNEVDVFYRGYVRVEIDEEFFKSIQSDLRLARLKSRLGGVFFAAVLVLGSLGVLWSWLFMRLKSRGLYIKRIRWITVALSVLLLVICCAVYTMLF